MQARIHRSAVRLTAWEWAKLKAAEEATGKTPSEILQAALQAWIDKEINLTRAAVFAHMEPAALAEMVREAAEAMIARVERRHRRVTSRAEIPAHPTETFPLKGKQ